MHARIDPADTTSAMTTAIEVRYFAAARAAAGHESEELEATDADTLVSLVERLGRTRPALARVLERCSFLRDSVVVRDRDARLLPCSVVEVLPPFAGG